jgi:hypothetical protein
MRFEPAPAAAATDGLCAPAAATAPDAASSRLTNPRLTGNRRGSIRSPDLI